MVIIDHRDEYFLQMMPLEMLPEDNNNPNQLLYYPNEYDYPEYQEHFGIVHHEMGITFSNL
jgi:hypothetical protein